MSISAAVAATKAAKRDMAEQPGAGVECENSSRRPAAAGVGAPSRTPSVARRRRKASPGENARACDGGRRLSRPGDGRPACDKRIRQSGGQEWGSPLTVERSSLTFTSNLKKIRDGNLMRGPLILSFGLAMLASPAAVAATEVLLEPAPQASDTAAPVGGSAIGEDERLARTSLGSPRLTKWRPTISPRRRTPCPATVSGDDVLRLDAA